MAEVFLGLGSNIDADDNIRSALNALEKAFGKLICSAVYQSEAVGFEGDDFLNLVVSIETDKTVSQLAEMLRRIENQHGRVRNVPKFSGRTLDIDILLYDTLVGNFDGVVLPRDEIEKNAFVLRPLSELVPQKTHPVSGASYQDMWAQYDKAQQKLWPYQLGKR